MDYEVIITEDAEADMDGFLHYLLFERAWLSKVKFKSYRYFMLYRVEEDKVYVDNIFHELQDYENRTI